MASTRLDFCKPRCEPAASAAARHSWALQDHVSFVTSHPGHSMLDTVAHTVAARLLNVTLFPAHCVAGTRGAALAGGCAAGLPGVAAAVLFYRGAALRALASHRMHALPAPDGLERRHIAHIVKKGQQAQLESFSAFYDQAHAASTGGRALRGVTLFGCHALQLSWLS